MTCVAKPRPPIRRQTGLDGCLYSFAQNTENNEINATKSEMAGRQFSCDQNWELHAQNRGQHRDQTEVDTEIKSCAGAQVPTIFPHWCLCTAVPHVQDAHVQDAKCVCALHGSARLVVGHVCTRLRTVCTCDETPRWRQPHRDG